MTNGQVSIAIKHNFETAHRLPFLEGKCQSIHGHTWWTTINVYRYDLDGALDKNGLSTEFSLLKKIVRQYIDDYLDHGTMLGYDDPLLHAFIEDNSKVFIFGKRPTYAPYNDEQTNYWEGFPWPTVEAVAAMLASELQANFDVNTQLGKVWVDSVKVEEGPVNSALWVPTLNHKVVDPTPKWSRGDDR